MFVDPKWMRYSAAMSSAVMGQAVMLYLAFRAGSYLDAKWGTQPFLMFFGLVIAGALGLWFIIYAAERFKPPR